MKYILCLVLLVDALAMSAIAAAPKRDADAEQLGTMAGLALACGSQKKLEDFELISSRLIANEAPTEKEELEQVRIYTEAKWAAMQRQKRHKVVSCREILDRFNDLPIFGSTVYKDGSVLLPDGVWSRPLRPVKR